MEDDTDLGFALMAADPFGYGYPEEWHWMEFDVPLDMVQTAIINFYFVDS